MTQRVGCTQVVSKTELDNLGPFILERTFQKMVYALNQKANEEGVVPDWMTVQLSIEPFLHFKEWEVEEAVPIGLEMRLRVQGD